jgi:2Fe-2S ferredoxin
MPKLNITTRDGETREVEGQLGLSVMEIVRDQGFEEMLALCGGCCSCATCHVHVAEDWLDQLPPMSVAENDLLESSIHRTASSRLSCQLHFSADLDGLRVTLAAAD